MERGEFIVVLLLGFFMGICAGYYISHREIVPYFTQTYEAEINRQHEWNKIMLKSLVNSIEKKK